jgi:hypothetical protein
MSAHLCHARIIEGLLAPFALLLAVIPLQAQTRATLLEPVSVPILQNGKPIGSAIARPGTLVQILNRTGDSVEISTPLGTTTVPSEQLLTFDDPAPKPTPAKPTPTPRPIPQKTPKNLPPKNEIAPENLSKRAFTDPLLKISTGESLFSGVEYDASIQGKRDPDAKPPQYKRALGRSNVIMLSPHNEEKPAELDFSPITTKSKGKLRLLIRDHPYGDFRLQITKGCQTHTDKIMDTDQWKPFTVSYDHEPVILKSHATGWIWEHSFISYSISPE